MFIRSSPTLRIECAMCEESHFLRLKLIGNAGDVIGIAVVAATTLRKRPLPVQIMRTIF
jgi:hypothetical protein